ncbi:type 1 glutamine amidotransferase domain-containing protein [Rheinheimera sp.]|uniref:type 1 glutamine amidotransferase domain-containing protein n=1 Tax=Rheinheimera sp. TaxID=1869214 RepID=UPI00307D00FE
MANVLIVVTSDGSCGHEKSGLWLAQLAIPYYLLLHAGHTLTLASPKGGSAPIDPDSLRQELQTPESQRFLTDRNARSALADTLKLQQLYPSDFQGVFYAGGLGLLKDLIQAPCSIRLLKETFALNRPVALIGHAAAVLLWLADDKHKPLVEGRKITMLSQQERQLLHPDCVLPLDPANELIQRGALLSTGPAHQPYVVQDGTLFTGQNTASAVPLTQQFLAALPS